MNLADLMRANGIERIVYVPATDLLPRDMFHAWRFDNHLECGRGPTPEAAIEDARALERRAA